MNSKYDVHEFAKLFPDATPDEFEKLKADIKANGLQDPITIHEGKILDGRTRDRACEETGTERKFQPLPPGVDPLTYVVSKNLIRRHLTVSQRAVIADELVELEAKQEKADPSTAKPGSKAERAAKAVTVSPRSVATVAAIKKAAPELIEKMKAGTETLSTAKKKVDAKKAKALKPDPATDAKKVAKRQGNFIAELDICRWNGKGAISSAIDSLEDIESMLKDNLGEFFTVTDAIKKKVEANVQKIAGLVAILKGLDLSNGWDFDFSEPVTITDEESKSVLHVLEYKSTPQVNKSANAAIIAKEKGLPRSKVDAVLANLMSMGIVVCEKGRYRLVKKSVPA